jgi:hypothetical protein
LNVQMLFAPMGAEFFYVQLTTKEKNFSSSTFTMFITRA